MGFFNVPKDLVVAADEQTSGFVGLPSGIYTAKILAAYLVESGNSDAKSLTVQYQVDGNERVFYESLWYQEGRGLNTYSCKKTGNEVLLPSFTKMLDLFAAANVNVDQVSPEQLKVSHFGTEGMYPVFKDFTGKIIKIGARHLLKDNYKDSTEVDDTHEIELYIGDDDKTGGEIRGAKNAYSVAGWSKMIAKKPTKDQRKDSKGGSAAPSAKTSGSEEGVASVKSW